MDTLVLDPSPLGTQEHWENVYESELKMFEECGDEGEIWFGKPTALRMISFLKSWVKEDDPIVDLGCGNGMLLFEAWISGFKNLLGIDYSARAIELASSIAKSKGCLASFKVADIVSWTGSGALYKVVLDKGTYDAICLNPNDAVKNRKAYINVIRRILSEDGVFVIATCNWTEQEIIAQFLTKLVHVETLPSPTFTFGGKSGSRTTIAVFKRLQKSPHS